jgi:hypothetical protein
MVREDVGAKAKRLLGEGRVTIRLLTDDAIEANVRGDSARLYEVPMDTGRVVVPLRCRDDAMQSRSGRGAGAITTVAPGFEGEARGRS